MRIIFASLFVMLLADSSYCQLYKFDKAINRIVTKKLNKDSGVLLYQPYSIEVTGDTLILTDTSNEPSVRVFNVSEKNELKHLKSFGDQGRGPGEYKSPWNVIYSHKSNNFYIYDPGLRRLTPYTRDLELLPDHIINFKTRGLYIDIFEYKDGFIASGISLDGCRFEEVNLEGEVTGCLGKTPDLGLKPDINKRSSAERWHSYSDLHQKEEKLALFYRFAARASIFSLKGERLHSIQDTELGTPYYEIHNGYAIGGGNDRIAYLSVTSDEKHIYALYSGKLSSAPSSYVGTYIHKFDWELNLLDIFELDHLSIHIESIGKDELYSVEYEPEPSIRYVVLKNDE